ncbi:hypothetical protein TTHERM_00062670 (macronuclear) [Tetrahymena thermophila SB210]|uniref:Uncharacterized protein n=1 Tax=Tetrahymena thermophila (strain SB210) TaxID=312017 RepID=I7MHE5_TETTS|nr:hypothetical protein TTHERM_00062670 [Tetrahymena thermophila SB210]EAR87457.2 hypothetical protein TTHERM_00062670 [Tetrahymena thermophila SB210]|eukprot:XP_001007702.2 hypothetical protein TTHERM_00062670 [Tetrahymena thermophila SB210]
MNKQLDGLEDISDYFVSLNVVRLPLMLLRLQNNTSVFQLYLNRTQFNVDQHQAKLNQLYELVQSQYQVDRYQQTELDNYLFAAFEGEACTLLSQNTDLITNSSTFSLSACLEVQNGIINTVFIKKLKQSLTPTMIL